jgi:hypothetical protein
VDVEKEVGGHLTSVTWNPMFEPDAQGASARALRAASRVATAVGSGRAAGGALAVRHASSKQRANAIVKRIDRLQAQEQVGSYAPRIVDFLLAGAGYGLRPCRANPVHNSHPTDFGSSTLISLVQENAERWERMVGELKHGRMELGDAVAIKALEADSTGSPLSDSHRSAAPLRIAQ